MKDALEIFILVLLMFPFGMGFAVFFRWLTRQKREPLQRQGVVDGWFWLTNWGILFNLGMGLWMAAERNWDELIFHGVALLCFLSMGLGGWIETKRFEKRP